MGYKIHTFIRRAFDKLTDVMSPENINESFEVALGKALTFLTRSIEVNGGRGSSHSFSYWLNRGVGWNEAYPETTGYIIPTLIKSGDLGHKKDLAYSSAEWLLDIQDDAGWFYSGTQKNKGPSVFNTAMVIHGLTVAFLHFDEERFKLGAARSVDWIIDQQEEDGSILNFAFQPLFFPSYYSRVLWSVAEYNQLKKSERISKFLRGLHRALKPLFNNGLIQSAGFQKGASAYLHTIAYAIRGAQESQRIDPSLGLIYKNTIKRLVQLRKEKGGWPGRIDGNGVGDFSFRCLTGEAQMAIILFKSNIPEWHDLAIDTLIALLPTLGRWGQSKGALPGSRPFWGAYNPLRYPNWATKFLADAILLFMSNSKGKAVSGISEE